MVLCDHTVNAEANCNPDPVLSELLPPIIEALPTWDLEPPTLLPQPGPTAFPEADTTKIVEQSTHRVVSMEPPRAPRALLQNARPTEAVEEDLEYHFARVVEPWKRVDELM